MPSTHVACNTTPPVHPVLATLYRSCQGSTRFIDPTSDATKCQGPCATSTMCGSIITVPDEHLSVSCPSPPPHTLAAVWHRHLLVGAASAPTVAVPQTDTGFTAVDEHLKHLLKFSFALE